MTWRTVLKGRSSGKVESHCFKLWCHETHLLPTQEEKCGVQEAVNTVPLETPKLAESQWQTGGGEYSFLPDTLKLAETWGHIISIGQLWRLGNHVCLIPSAIHIFLGVQFLENSAKIAHNSHPGITLCLCGRKIRNLKSRKPCSARILAICWVEPPRKHFISIDCMLCCKTGVRICTAQSCSEHSERERT